MVKKCSHKKSSFGQIDAHKMWIIIAFAFALLVVAVLFIYPAMKGEGVGAGKAVALPISGGASCNNLGNVYYNKNVPAFSLCFTGHQEYYCSNQDNFGKTLFSGLSNSKQYDVLCSPIVSGNAPIWIECNALNNGISGTGVMLQNTGGIHLDQFLCISVPHGEIPYERWFICENEGTITDSQGYSGITAVEGKPFKDLGYACRSGVWGKVTTESRIISGTSTPPPVATAPAPTALPTAPAPTALPTPTAPTATAPAPAPSTAPDATMRSDLTGTQDIPVFSCVGRADGFGYLENSIPSVCVDQAIEKCDLNKEGTIIISASGDSRFLCSNFMDITPIWRECAANRNLIASGDYKPIPHYQGVYGDKYFCDQVSIGGVGSFNAWLTCAGESVTIANSPSSYRPEGYMCSNSKWSKVTESLIISGTSTPPPVATAPAPTAPSTAPAPTALPTAPATTAPSTAPTAPVATMPSGDSLEAVPSELTERVPIVDSSLTEVRTVTMMPEITAPVAGVRVSATVGAEIDQILISQGFDATRPGISSWTPELISKIAALFKSRFGQQTRQTQ